MKIKTNINEWNWYFQEINPVLWDVRALSSDFEVIEWLFWYVMTG